MNKLLFIFLAFALGVNAQTTQGSTTFDTGAVVDGKLAGKFVVKGGTAAPPSGDCDALAEVGSIYLRSDDPATNPSVSYRCLQTGASTYAWDLMNATVGTTAPATCVVGQLFFDSDATAGSNLFGCTASNTWTALGGGGGAGNFFYDFTTEEGFVDGFTGSSTTSGTMGWTHAGGTLTQPASTAGRIGIIRHATGAGASAVAYISRSAGNNIVFDPADTFKITWMVKPNHVNDNTVIRVGATGTSISTAQPSNGLYFEGTAGATNWKCIARAGSSETGTNNDAGSNAFDTNWVRLEIRRSGSNIICSVNGVDTNTYSSNIPTTILNPWRMITNGAAGGDKTIDTDLAALRVTGLTK